MLHVGLDLSRRRLDYCLLDEGGERVEPAAAPPDGDGLRGPGRGVERRYGPVVVRAAIESMNGARFVHDTLERCGWEVEVADAQKVKGLAPLACKTDRIDAWVLAELSRRDLVPAIWLPSFELRAERERARWRLFLVRKRSSLKHRIHAQLLAFGHPCPVSDLFGRQGRELLERLDFPEPWRSRSARRGRDDRRSRPPDHRDRPRAEGAGCRPPLHPAADDRTRDRVGARLHDRRRDRRHPPVQLADEAVRLHRPVPARLPVRQHRPPRARSPTPARNTCGGR